jgi:transcription antitermination factor NusG
MSVYTKGGKRRARLERRGGPVSSVRTNEVIREQTLTTRALIEPENLRWFVLRVQSQQEERVIRSLDLRAIPAAIPTVPKERTRRGTTYRWRTPIAHGYVLIGIPGSGEIPWWDLLQIDYVWSPVKDDQGNAAQAPWRTTYEDDGEIKRGGVEVLLPDLVSVRVTAAEYMRRARRFEKDTPVQIKEGPFAGFDGKVESATDAQVSILASIFGRQTKITVPVADVKRIKEAKAA